MVNVENFKLSVFIATIEYQVSAMVPSKPVTHYILRTCVDNSIIPSAILHDDGFYL